MAQSSALKQGLGIAGWLLASFTTAALGGLASINASGFNAQRAQSSWAPSGWLFGPVWTVLTSSWAFLPGSSGESMASGLLVLR
jgi:tryptophan-rich sensory protein